MSQEEKMTIYIDVNDAGTVKGWGSSWFDGAVELQIPISHPFLTGNPFFYQLIDGQLVKSSELELERAKLRKDNELNYACSQDITRGFTHTINGVEYFFSYDFEAQINFQDAREMFDEGLEDSINWTVKRDGVYERIPMTKDLLKEIKYTIMAHKNSKIVKYREFLLPLVQSALTVEEVQSIRW